MFRSQLLSTKIGVMLTLLLMAVALVPSFHWAWLAAKGVMLLVMLFYVWRINTRDNTLKRLTLRVEGVPENEATLMTQHFKKLFGEALTVMPTSKAANALVLRLEEKTTIAAVSRRLKKAHLPISLMGIDGRMTYTAISGEAHMRVEVEGVAAPHSQVFIADIEDATTADKDGHFKVAVPFALVKRHQSRGYIPAEWRKDRVSKKIQIPIPR